MKVYFAHATGFCGTVWRPVKAELGPGLEGVWWDFPGHGVGPRLSNPIDWWDFGSFVLTKVETGGVGVGHSMGGTALVMAELLFPGTFASLVLIEPVILPPPFAPQDHSLSEMALKRRRGFASLDEARSNYTSKPPFATWHPDAIEGYLEGGFRAEAAGVTLACVPEDEAAIYRMASAHGVWDRLPEVSVPVLVIASDDPSPNQPGRHARSVASRLPRAGFELVEHSTHFLPMERPALVAQRISRIAIATMSE
jgi:pimeloyl-ACP methyl ester carboxylesterase